MLYISIQYWSVIHELRLGCFLAKPKNPYLSIYYFDCLLGVIDPTDDDGDIHFSEKSTLWSVWGLEGSKIEKCDFFKGSKSGFMYVVGF